MKTIFLILIGITIIVTASYSFLAFSYPSVQFGVDEDSECWVDIGDGVLTKCQMTGEFPPHYNPIPHPSLEDVFCEENCQENTSVIVGGELALEVCNVIGGSCATYYPGIMNQNGSITVGQVIYDHGTTEYYQFLIQNETLVYV